jgi:hypothetical protein
MARCFCLWRLSRLAFLYDNLIITICLSSINSTIIHQHSRHLFSQRPGSTRRLQTANTHDNFELPLATLGVLLAHSAVLTGCFAQRGHSKLRKLQSPSSLNSDEVVRT